MTRSRTLIYLVLALLLSLWGIPVYAQQEVPPLPHAFFGNLTVDGKPALVGTRVEARGNGVITGVEGNPLITTVAGKYGGPDVVDRKLIVQGNIVPDTLIKFYVNGADTGQACPFRAGETQRLDLSIVTTTAVLTVTTNLATSVAITSATLNGNLLNLGTASSVIVSFEWGATTSCGNTTTAQTMSAPGPFSATLSNLAPATTYYFVARAVSANGTSYGLPIMSFITAAVVSDGIGQTPIASSPGQTLLTDKISSQGVMTQSVTAESANATCRLTINSGTKALAKDDSPLPLVTVIPASQPPAPPENASIVGLVYDFGPDGATFNPPVTLRYSYNLSEIPSGVNEKDLVIAYYDKNEANWVGVESAVDTITKTITAPVSHFTSFGILGYKVVAPTAETPAAPATFSLSSLIISPTQATIGETVSISIWVANSGGQSGKYTVLFKVGSDVEAIKEVAIPAGATIEVSFSTVKNVPGTYAVDVGGLTGSFVVKEASAVPAVSTPQEPSSSPSPPPTPASEINWVVIGGIIAGMVLLSVVILFILRRRAY